jgi:prepilin-type N-terminal cleavage/methylation domain-containing protein
MTKTSSKGFTLIETLIVMLVIAVAVYAGWFIWQMSHKKDNKASQTSQNQKQENSNKDPQATAIDQSEDGKYLVIKEWDVRLPLPDALRDDVEYGIFDFNDGGQAIYFASKKIAAKSTIPDCGGLVDKNDSTGHGTFGGAVSLSRFTSKSQDDDAAELAFQQGDYWYKVDFSNGGACYDDDTGAETGAFKSAMNAAVRKLEPVKE